MACSSGSSSSGNDQTRLSGRGGLGRAGGFGAAAARLRGRAQDAGAAAAPRDRRADWPATARRLTKAAAPWPADAAVRPVVTAGRRRLAADVRPPAEGFPAERRTWRRGCRRRRRADATADSAVAADGRLTGDGGATGRFAAPGGGGKAVRPGAVPGGGAPGRP